MQLQYSNINLAAGFNMFQPVWTIYETLHLLNYPPGSTRGEYVQKGKPPLSILTWCFTKLPHDIAVLQPRTGRSPRLLFRAGSAASTSGQQGRTTHGTRQRCETAPMMTNQGAGPWENQRYGVGSTIVFLQFAQVPNHLTFQIHYLSSMWCITELLKDNYIRNRQRAD